MSHHEPAGNEPTARSVEPEPGDAQSVPVPNEDALEGSSETFQAVEGVRIIHPPADQGETGAQADGAEQPERH